MLRETSRRFASEGIDTSTVTLARADIGCLPLASASIDCMHAGAALHCWPELEKALQEVGGTNLQRALRPAGAF